MYAKDKFIFHSYYVFHGRVTLFFAYNSLTQCSDHDEIFTHFFSNKP